jgi:hypothetical protein
MLCRLFSIAKTLIVSTCKIGCCTNKNQANKKHPAFQSYLLEQILCKRKLSEY